MLFEDYFYPDNPQRRRQVYELRGEIVSIVRRYKAEWNEIVFNLNSAFAQAKHDGFNFELIPLVKDIDKDPLSDCISEIDVALKDANKKLPQLIKDMNIEDKLPKDWATNPKAIDINPDTIHKICQAISAPISGSVGVAVFIYVHRGVHLLQALLGFVVEIGHWMLSPVIAVVCASITGGLAFAITDMVVSAITGAIERKELNEAIDALKKLKERMMPLDESISKMAGININIRHGFYPLDDDHILIKKQSGEWIIIDRPKLCMATGDNNEIMSILEELRQEDGIVVIAA